MSEPSAADPSLSAPPSALADIGVTDRPSPPPFHQSSAAACLLAGCMALLAWWAIVAQVDISIARALSRGMTALQGVGRAASYLTNLTDLMAAICFTCVALRAPSGIGLMLRRPAVITGVTLYLAFVGIAYNLLLRHLWQPSGYREILNETLHTVLPLLALAYWVLFVPQFQLTLKKCLLWLVYPLSYLAAVLWLGDASGFYPYPFIDVEELGYPSVLRNAALLLAAFLTLVALFAAFNRMRKEAVAQS